MACWANSRRGVFVRQQQHAGQQQRHHYVDQPVQQQCGSQRRRTQLVGKGRQQNRLEHPDPARYMAEHTCRQGQQIHQHERAERGRFGQQQVQHGSGSCHIQCSDQQLQGSQAGIRQAQGAAPQLHQQVIGQWLFGKAPTVQADDQQGRGDQHRTGDACQQALGQAKCAGCSPQIAQGRQGGQGRKRAAQRQAGKNGHACDLASAQPMAGVQAVAHRAAREHRQADGVADGERTETTQHQGRCRQLHPGIAAGRPLIAQQDHEADHRRDKSAQQRLRRHTEHGVVQGVDVQLAEQVAASDQGHGEQQQGHRKADGLAVAAQAFEQRQALYRTWQHRGERYLGFGVVRSHELPRASSARWRRGAAK